MENVKFNDQQAKRVQHLRNIKERLHKANSSIWYNKACKQMQMTPKYNGVGVL